MSPSKEPSVAQVVALANRFLSFKASPGFHDLRLLCQMLEQEAAEAARDYQGFDAQEIVKLQMQAQTAHKLVAQIFTRIDAAIANAQGLPGFRLEEGQEPMIAERIAGSY